MASSFHDFHGFGDDLFFSGSPATGFVAGEDEIAELYLDPNAFDGIGLFDPSFSGVPSPSPSPSPSPPSTVSPAADSGEEHEMSDFVFTYISDMLLGENMDDKLDGYLEPSALHATEKSLIDALGAPPEDLPPPPPSSFSSDRSSDDSSNHSISGGSSSSLMYSSSSDFSSQSSFGSSSNGTANHVENLEETLLSSGWVPDFDAQFALQFRKGVEEAKKFLPSDDLLVINLESGAGGGDFSPAELKNGGAAVKTEEEEERDFTAFISRGRKNPYSEDSDDPDEQRSNKHSAFSSVDPVRSEEFDRVLLCSQPIFCQEAKDPCDASPPPQEAQQKSSGAGGRSARGNNKTKTKKDMVDIRTLLMHCAQAVSADDRRSATELLKQIKSHGSQFGDGNQRLAHYFADGLEARLAGTGSLIYQSKVSKRIPTVDVLKAYQLYLSASPFKRMTFFFSNRTILKLAEGASRLHIVDFGIHLGFQWPCFMQFLSERPGGPPKLRITGIEVPRPGFRPDEMVEETGSRLADYARTFRIPFEYSAIAAKWESIRAEDIKVEEGELLVVNSMFRLHTVADETVTAASGESPRDAVLGTIRKLNPDLFVTSVVNGAFSAPFFVTRFREALFHFSTMFDMLESNAGREDPQRLCLESNVFGKEIVNVIACEGAERVERPETYKQWQGRIRRAGFEMAALDGEMVRQAKCRVRSMYHKEFMYEEEGRWLLQGWKGRIVNGLSIWKPRISC